MREIHKKIVHDEEMRPIAVQIDYEDWLEIERQLENSNQHETGDLSRYCGAIRLTEDPVKYQKRIREEWS